MSIETDDVKRMDILAQTVFAPVYPLIARQIVDKFKITKLTISALDISPEMTSIADANIAEEKLTHRIHTVLADVHDMPFDNGYVSLIVSRGSIFFWENRPTAFKEIYRILKPGGVAYCGGGFGSEKVKKKVESRIMANKALYGEREAWKKRVGKNQSKTTVQKFHQELIRANVPGTVVQENGGIWVEIRKEVACEEE